MNLHGLVVNVVVTVPGVSVIELAIITFPIDDRGAVVIRNMALFISRRRLRTVLIKALLDNAICLISHHRYFPIGITPI